MTTPPPQASTEPPPRKRKSCAKCGCITAGIIALFLIVGAIGLRIYIRSEIPDDLAKNMRQIEAKFLSLPPKWHKPATPPPPEIVAFQNHFYDHVENLRNKYDTLLFGDYTSPSLLQKLRTSTPLDHDEETSLPLFLAELQPLLKKTSRTVAHPEYTVEMDLYTTDTTHFLEVQIFAKYASIAALAQARNGDCHQAVETAILPIRYVRRPPQSDAITHLISIAATGISLGTMNALADQCTDTIALQHGLALLEKYRESAFPGDIKQWRHGDTLGALRRAAANGYPVDLSPQKLTSIYKQVSEVRSLEYYEWITENLPPSDIRVAAARAIIEARKSTPGYPVQDETWLDSIPFEPLTPVFEFIYGGSPAVLLYSMAASGLEEAAQRAFIVSAKYDLTRLHFAQRLAELTGQTEPTNPPDVSAYINSIPTDPFVGAPVLYSQPKNTYYSVGPDKKNNDAKIIYNATNGTVSNGDLILHY